MGSDDPTWAAVWLAAFCLSLAGADRHALSRASPAQRAALAAPVLAVLALAALAAAQAWSGAPWLAPDPIWARAADLLGAPWEPRLASARGLAASALVTPALGAAAFARAVWLGCEEEGPRRLRAALRVATAGMAVYALIAYALAPGWVLWTAKTAHRDSLTATFLNRNVAAAYFGVGAMAWGAYLVRLSQASRAQAPRGRDIRGPAPRSWRRGVAPWAGALVCAVALVATRSRAGVVIWGGAAVAAIAWIATSSRGPHAERRRAVALVAGAFGAGLWFTAWASRVNLLGFDDLARRRAYAAIWDLAWERPWLGWGLGAFELVFPRRRPFDLPGGVWNRAHDGPLELAVEIGFPAALVVLTAAAATIVLLLRASAGRRRDVVTAAAVAVAAACHSLVDFPLQVPGFLIVACGVVGVGLSRALAPSAR